MSDSGIVTHHQTCVCGNDIDSHFLDTRIVIGIDRAKSRTETFRGSCLCNGCDCEEFVARG